MGLLKRAPRKKKPKARPARQLICRECGAAILADDFPGTCPRYECSNCGVSNPPNPKLQQLRQAKREAAGKEAAEEMRTRALTRKSGGLPAIWAPERFATKEYREKEGQQVRRGEQKILAILKGNARSNAGRKSDPNYDKAEYRQKVAHITGKELPLYKSVEDLLEGDKSTKESKRAKAYQAFRRRRKG